MLHINSISKIEGLVGEILSSNSTCSINLEGRTMDEPTESIEAGGMSGVGTSTGSGGDGLGGKSNNSSLQESIGTSSLRFIQYSPERIGIWKDMKQDSFSKYAKTFRDFCRIIYTDHSMPPTRKQLLDFLVARRAAKYCGNSLWCQYSHLKKVS